MFFVELKSYKKTGMFGLACKEEFRLLVLSTSDSHYWTGQILAKLHFPGEKFCKAKNFTKHLTPNPVSNIALGPSI